MSKTTEIPKGDLAAVGTPVPVTVSKVRKHARASSISALSPGDTDHILKTLLKHAHNTSSQCAVIFSSPNGNNKIYATSAFQGYLQQWIPEHVRRQASQVAISAAEEKAVRRRRPDGHAPPEKIAVSKQMGMAPPGSVKEEGGMEVWGDDGPIADPQSPQSFDGAQPPAQSLAERKKKRTQQIEKEAPRKKKTKPPHDPNAETSESEGEQPSRSDYNPLRIGDSLAVETFYMTRLRQMQQQMCKVVAKAWIKVVEPKKQSRYPYNRGDSSKPPWWPREVRHKEPDHLMKPERLTLLLAILRCDRVPISKLESATHEVIVQLVTLAADRLPLLEEVYRVATHEERLKREEIPPDLVVMVAASEKIIRNPNEDKPSSPAARRHSLVSTTDRHSSRRPSMQSHQDLHVHEEQPDEEILVLEPSPDAQDDTPVEGVPGGQHMQFSTADVSASMEPLDTVSYSTSPYASQSSSIHHSPQIPQQVQPQFIANELQTPNFYMSSHPGHSHPGHSHPGHRHSVSFPANPQVILRTPAAVPSVTQQPSPGHVYPWPQSSQGGPLVNDMYQQYGPGGHSPHAHNPLVHTQSLSNPSTPATAASFQLSSHPLHQAHHPQPQRHHELRVSIDGSGGGNPGYSSSAGAMVDQPVNFTDLLGQVDMNSVHDPTESGSRGNK